MAQNEDSSLPVRHLFVTAKTGGGKSQIMRNHLVPAKGVRAFFWDPDKDHYCERYTSKKEFLNAVHKALTGGGTFRIGWSGEDDQATFTWFCGVVWRCLDGDFDTYVILEELADLEMGQKTLPGLGKLLKRGRKYGAIVIGNTQRVQEVPKGLITQAKQSYIGKQSAHDAKYLSRVLGLDARLIENQENLHFFTKPEDKWIPFKSKYKPYGEKKRKRNLFNFGKK
jgi:hypothetical protein